MRKNLSPNNLFWYENKMNCFMVLEKACAAYF